MISQRSILVLLCLFLLVNCTFGSKSMGAAVQMNVTFSTRFISSSPGTLDCVPLQPLYFWHAIPIETEGAEISTDLVASESQPIPADVVDDDEEIPQSSNAGCLLMVSTSLLQGTWNFTAEHAIATAPPWEAQCEVELVVFETIDMQVDPACESMEINFTVGETGCSTVCF